MIVDINEWSWLKSRDHFFAFKIYGMQIKEK